MTNEFGSHAGWRYVLVAFRLACGWTAFGCLAFKDDHWIWSPFLAESKAWIHLAFCIMYTEVNCQDSVSMVFAMPSLHEQPWGFILQLKLRYMLEQGLCKSFTFCLLFYLTVGIWEFRLYWTQMIGVNNSSSEIVLINASHLKRRNGVSSNSFIFSFLSYGTDFIKMRMGGGERPN